MVVRLNLMVILHVLETICTPVLAVDDYDSAEQVRASVLIIFFLRQRQICI